MNNNNFHSSETLKVGILLAISGGIMDTYSYICRGKVFANAQTGNMILFGINLYDKKWDNVIKYGLPIISFIVGVFFANIIKQTFKEHSTIHWRQAIILFEIFIFSSIGFFPQNLNFIVNNLISLACGMQVESFKNILEHGISTTMCIGNLKSGVSSFYDYFKTYDLSNLKKSLIYFILIISFIIGGIFGNYTISLFKEKAIFSSNLFLIAAFYLISLE